MTEAEWLNCDDPCPRQLAIIHEVASVRKLRLIAAVYVRGAQTRPEYEYAIPCDDVIEAVADHPVPWQELEPLLLTRGETWQFTRVLCPVEETPTAVARVLRKLMSMWVSDNPRSVPEIIRLVHEVVGNPFRPVAVDPQWLTSDVLSLARGIYEDRAFDRMPILGDALQDAGCENADILDHSRDPNGVHVRGCWVVDCVLGKS